MRLRSSLLTIPALAMFFLVPRICVAGPVTIFSDYGPGMTFSGTNGWCVSGPSTPNCGPEVVRWIAAPFTPSGNFTLGQIDLPFNFVSGTNGGVVELVSSVGGLPSTTVLETWTLTSLPPSFAPSIITLNSSGGVTLLNGVQYWIVAMPSATDTLDFWFNNTLGENGTLASINSGASWISNVTLTAFDVLGTPTATPEPSSLLLLGTGLLGLGFAVRRFALS